MTALEHLSILVGEEYKPLDLSFGTSNISDSNSSKKGRRKLDICTYQHSLDNVFGVCFRLLQSVH